MSTTKGKGTGRGTPRHSSGGRRPPPTEFGWDAINREQWYGREWYMKTSLVTDGDLRHLWEKKDAGTIAISLLPLLGLHADFERWRKAKNAKVPISTITEVTLNVGCRRLAGALGYDKNSIRSALEALDEEELIDIEWRKSKRAHSGREIHRIRIDDDMLLIGYKPQTHYTEKPVPSERYAKFYGDLFYGGPWRLMPSAIRFVYLVIAARNPVYAEEEFRAGLRKQVKQRLRKEHGATYAMKKSEVDRLVELAIQAKRREKAPTRKNIMKDTSMGRTYVHHVLKALSTPPDPAALPSPAPFLSSGRSADGDAYFVPNDSAGHSHRWPAKDLNDPDRVKELRRLLFPSWPFERSRPKRRKRPE